jgi:hypothetical protein
MAVNSIRGLGIQDNLDCLVKCGLARVEITSNESFAAPPATSAESILAERFLNLCISRRGDIRRRAGILNFSLAPRVTSSGLGAPEAARRARVGQGGTIPSCSPGARNGAPGRFVRGNSPKYSWVSPSATMPFAPLPGSSVGSWLLRARVADTPIHPPSKSLKRMGLLPQESAE